jgi:hypothetical protein
MDFVPVTQALWGEEQDGMHYPEEQARAIIPLPHLAASKALASALDTLTSAWTLLLSATFPYRNQSIASHL